MVKLFLDYFFGSLFFHVSVWYASSDVVLDMKISTLKKRKSVLLDFLYLLLSLLEFVGELLKPHTNCRIIPTFSNLANQRFEFFSECHGLATPTSHTKQ